MLDLWTNHEEADKKLCYLLRHAHQHNDGEETVGLLRSPSGNIDIPVILLANEMQNVHVYIDNGAGKNRKLLDLTSCNLSCIQKQALLGVHMHSLAMITFLHSRGREREHAGIQSRTMKNF